MGFETAIYALLHVLVFVYWLGGDLGAFYSSRFLTVGGIDANRRLMAAKIVSDVDMAPRTALILTLPTGLLLALSKGWIDGPLWLGWLGLGLGGLWLAIAWKLHLHHTEGGVLKRFDTVIRWALLIALTIVGIAGLASAVRLPLFISLKLLLLAAAILMGLLIRIVLKPLGPALMGLAGADPTSAEASLAATLKRARPLVLVIWAIITTAALLGLWTPNPT